MFLKHALLQALGKRFKFQAVRYLSLGFHLLKSSKMNPKPITGKSGMKIRFNHQLGSIEQGITSGYTGLFGALFS